MERITKEQLAAQINGRQYRDELTRKESEQAETSNLLVIYGASDDLLEFRGMIEDEAGAWDGTKVWVTKDRDIKEKKPSDKSFEVRALWCVDGKTSPWHIEVDVPYAEFLIMEDDDTFCRGVVVDFTEIFVDEPEYTI